MAVGRHITTGDVVAGYEVDVLVGRGGMGEVYEVEDLDLGGRVALKTLRPELDRKSVV